MKKAVLILVCILGLAWIASIKMQDKTRTPVAYRLIQQKMEELKSAGFEKLREKIGAGYIKESVVADGVHYPVVYAVTRVGAIKDIRHPDEKKLKDGIWPGERIDAIEILGFVDAITVVPFTDLRIGPVFSLIIRNE